MRDFPEAYLNKMKELLKGQYSDFLDSYGDNANQGLVVNSLKTDVKDFVAAAPFELTPVPWADDGFYYGYADRPGKHPYYDAGLYYIQEPSAMAPARLLDVKPGHKVLDLCAAPGGKAFQLAAALKNKGFLIANEIDAARVRVLGENLERMGVRNAAITRETPVRLAEVFDSYFDRILVDAPCSGEGMFRKNPEVRSMWSATLPDRCSRRQRDILKFAAQMLAPGGRMVYSTCTFSPEENEEVVDWFLKQYPDFYLVEIQGVDWFDSGLPEWIERNTELTKIFRIWPHRTKGEGHFIAVFERKPTGKAKSLPLFYKRWGLRKEYPGYKSFMEENICKEVEGPLYLHKDQLYLVPESLPDLGELRVLRPGFSLGVLRKGRFIPSHALALALKKQQVFQSIDLPGSSIEIRQYINGQTLNGFDGKGWVLVTVDGYSAGWGKLSEGLLKNHYPKGLRRLLPFINDGDKIH